MNCTAAARRLSIPALLALLVAVSGSAPAAQVAPEQRSVSAQLGDSIAITNVTLVDVVSGARQTATTVVTKAGEIADIGGAISVPRGAVRVDGTGKFLIPGLWDMHSHHQASGAESLDLFLANGVVGTRDMGSDLEFILPLRDRISRGELSGPEIVAAGPILDNRPADWPFRRRSHQRSGSPRSCQGSQEARRRFHQGARQHAARGVLRHRGRSAETRLVVCRPCSACSHGRRGVLTSGIKSIEHLSNYRVFRECSGKRAAERHASLPAALRQARGEKCVADTDDRLSFKPFLTCSPANRCPTPNMPAISFSS